LFNGNFVIKYKAARLKKKSLEVEKQSITLEDELEASEYGGFKLERYN
jgi:hypothetical protein